MTTEIRSSLSPREVLDAARRFFAGEDALGSAWLEGESESHVAFATFRGKLVVAAFPDPEEADGTRVRITTLREDGAMPRLVTYLRTLDAPGLVVET